MIALRRRTRSGSNRHASAGNWLLRLLCAASSCRAGRAAAFSVFIRLQVTHINLWFVFLLFAHITFLTWVFGFGLCQSRRNNAVLRRPFRLGSGHPGGLACLSNASAVELHAPQNLRPSCPSTNSRAPYYHDLCQCIFSPTSSADREKFIICNPFTMSVLSIRSFWQDSSGHSSFDRIRWPKI